MFIGSISANAELNTLSSLDVVNGGTGVDTLKISTDIASTTAIVTPNMSNVEVIEVTATLGANINTTSVSGLTNLNIVKAGTGAVTATAAATTDVSVNLKEVVLTADAPLANTIEGGKNVTVTAVDMGMITASAANSDSIVIGAAVAGTPKTAATGDVVVNITGKAYDAAIGDMTLGTTYVNGGKTITVTEKATSNSSAVLADTSAAKVVQGAVTVKADANTTTVTVKQDAAVTAVDAQVAVAGKAATQEVTFTEAKKGDTITLNFGTGALTFTAKTDLTAAQVASAFANLAAGAKQGSASATLGLYTDATGGVTNGWTSGAVQTVNATSSKVVFSTMTDSNAGTAGIQAGAITTSKTGTVTATASSVTDGTTAVTAKAGVMGVDNGIVLIDDVATKAIKTITVDGYAATSKIGNAEATTLLETLNLSNAQGGVDMVVADTAATLALTVEKLGSVTTAPATGVVTTTAAVVTLSAAPTTLNVTSTGNNVIDLNADATEALTVNGTGLLDISTQDLDALKTVVVSGTAGLKLSGAENDTITSVNTTATTGTVTVSINGDKATYTGGAGVDNVTVTNASTAINKAIDLGAGNDRLDLSATTPVNPTVVIEGGAGDDIIVLKAADAASLTLGTSFQSKINSFEKLEVNAVVASGGATVNLDNLNDINYVITKGGVTTNLATVPTVVETTPGVTGTTAEVQTITFTALAAGQSVTVDGRTVTATGALTAAQVGLAMVGTTVHANATVSGTSANWAFGGTDQTVTATNNANGNVAMIVPTVSTTKLTLDKMLTGATVQLDGSGNVDVVLKDATGLTDVVNVVANANGALGTVKAANVETINITTNDTDLLRTEVVTGGVSVVTENVSTSTLALDANKAATINLNGAGNLTLTLAATDTAVTLIDASTATGKIVVSTLAGDLAATTVKGGAGDDTITLAGANDVAIGGAGNDTLKVTTAAAATLTGGDGVDTFDVSGFKGTVGGAATITDFTKGESIKFISNAAADFNSGKVTLISESTFTEYVNEAMKAASANSTLTNGIAWFQFNGNTFVAQNIGADNTFNDGTDILVKITGLVDLSASSFNEVGEGTLLFV